MKLILVLLLIAPGCALLESDAGKVKYEMRYGDAYVSVTNAQDTENSYHEVNFDPESKQFEVIIEKKGQNATDPMKAAAEARKEEAKNMQLMIMQLIQLIQQRSMFQ